MSYYFWLGREGGILADAEKLQAHARELGKKHQSECKPEADGWITTHPNVSLVAETPSR